MKYLLSLAAFLVVSIATFAQSPTFDWVKNVAWGPKYQNVHNVAFSPSGDMYLGGGYLTNLVAGTTGINFEGGITLPKKTLSFNTWFGKFDSTAKPIWIKGFNVGRERFIFTQDKQGNLYVANRTTDTSTAFGNSIGANRPFIYKFDQNGNFLRADTFEFQASTDAITQILVDDSSNLYVGGYISFAMKVHGQTFPRIGSTDAFLIKFDAQGKLKWAKVFGGKNYQDGLTTLRMDSKGFLIIGGTCQGTTGNKAMFDTIQRVTNGKDRYIAKIHPSNGAVLWLSLTKGNARDDGLSAFALDENDNIYLTGNFGGGVAGFEELYFGNDTVKAHTTNFSSRTIGTGYVAKLDPNGNGIWGRRFGAPNTSTTGTDILYEKGLLYIYGSQSTVNILNDGTPNEQYMLNPFLDGAGYHFLAKVDTSNGLFLNGRPMSISQNQGMFGAAINNGKVYVYGNFKDRYMFGVDSIVSVDDEDAFIGVIGDLNYPQLPAPSNMRFNSSTSTSIDVSWDDNATTETGYHIIYGPPFAKQLSWPLSGSEELPANSINYNVTGLQAMYLYEIASIANYNNEVFSDTSNSVMDSTVVKVGLQPMMSNREIKLYPNPCIGKELTISSSSKIGEKIQITIFDINGKVVMDEQVLLEPVLLNTSQLSNGTYTVQIASKESIFYRRFSIAGR